MKTKAIASCNNEEKACLFLELLPISNQKYGASPNPGEPTINLLCRGIVKIGNYIAKHEQEVRANMAEKPNPIISPNLWIKLAKDCTEAANKILAANGKGTAANHALALFDGFYAMFSVHAIAQTLKKESLEAFNLWKCIFNY
jgi:hypothetical protein